ncbi:hypothetical protein N657DRAFT_369061 [Parathielavia appendiculata]|uniref:Uncharacterized protein n=1 Tax=Parathielavia appendiculata TaxID=2587402 RepID=A0AAN6TQ39_9PEZI|nr:hypothetical protein N657DRAFT_369061 [Parathielavia appendiculata]
MSKNGSSESTQLAGPALSLRNPLGHERCLPSPSRIHPGHHSKLREASKLGRTGRAILECFTGLRQHRVARAVGHLLRLSGDNDKAVMLHSHILPPVTKTATTGDVGHVPSTLSSERPLWCACCRVCNTGEAFEAADNGAVINARGPTEVPRKVADAEARYTTMAMPSPSFCLTPGLGIGYRQSFSTASRVTATISTVLASGL